MIERIVLSEKFDLISDYWKPRIIGELNDSHVKIAKLKGEFTWHAHDDEDELFIVVRGRLTIRMRDGEIVLNEGEMAVIPRGVEHQPVAEEEVHLLLVEPKSTLNTGNVRNDMTLDSLEWT